MTAVWIARGRYGGTAGEAPVAPVRVVLMGPAVCTSGLPDSGAVGHRQSVLPSQADRPTSTSTAMS